MREVKTLSPNDGLQDGFDLASGPPVGPDGMPLPLPHATRTPPRPSLCAAGPCQHYHRLEIQVEAQDPRGQQHPIKVPDGTPRTESSGDGTLYRPLPVFHTAVHHYCYPSSGIEIELGNVPVVSCNRHVLVESAARGSMREYERKLVEWTLARAEDQAEADEAERAIAASLSATSER